MAGYRRLAVLVGAVVVVVLVAAGVYLKVHSAGRPPAQTGPVSAGFASSAGYTTGPVPGSVAAALTGIASGDLESVRSRLEPDLATSLTAGDLLPHGSSLVPVKGSWKADATHGELSADLTEPGAPAKRLDLFFILKDHRWLLLLADAA